MHLKQMFIIFLKLNEAERSHLHVSTLFKMDYLFFNFDNIIGSNVLYIVTTQINPDGHDKKSTEYRGLNQR